MLMGVLEALAGPMDLELELSFALGVAAGWLSGLMQVLSLSLFCKDLVAFPKPTHLWDLMPHDSSYPGRPFAGVGQSHDPKAVCRRLFSPESSGAASTRVS